MNLSHRSGIGPGGLAMDMGGYGGGGIQDLLGEGTRGVGGTTHLTGSSPLPGPALHRWHATGEWWRLGFSPGPLEWSRCRCQWQLASTKIILEMGVGEV